MHWGELGLDEAIHDQKFLLSTKRGKRVLTESSPGDEDLTWTLNSRCGMHSSLYPAALNSVFGGCIIGSPKPPIHRCALEVVLLTACV